jgi:hypothetical protein
VRAASRGPPRGGSRAVPPGRAGKKGLMRFGVRAGGIGLRRAVCRGVRAGRQPGPRSAAMAVRRWAIEWLAELCGRRGTPFKVLSACSYALCGRICGPRFCMGPGWQSVACVADFLPAARLQAVGVRPAGGAAVGRM